MFKNAIKPQIPEIGHTVWVTDKGET